MSGKDLLLDSNILIYLSRGELKLNDFATPNDLMVISVITYMEVLGFDFKQKEEQEIIEDLCANLIVLPIDDEVVDSVIDLRRSHKLKLPDAIIAATTIIHDLTLITHDTFDFGKLKSNLEMLDPFSL